MGNVENNDTIMCKGEAQLIKGCMASDDEILKVIIPTLQSTDLSHQARIFYSAIRQIWLSGDTIDIDAIVTYICNDKELFMSACTLFAVKAPSEALKHTLKAKLRHELTQLQGQNIECPDYSLIDLARTLHLRQTENFLKAQLDNAIAKMNAGESATSVAMSLGSAIAMISDDNHIVMEPFHYELPQNKVEPLITHKGAAVIAKGNLHFIVGEAKTFKSLVAGKLMSAALGAEPENALGFEVTTDCCKVLHVDTEQYSGDLSERAIQILSDAGMATNEQHNEYKVYDMMKYSAKESLERTLILTRTEKPDLVVIDGLVDLVEDFNCVTESKAVIRQLLAAAATNGCAIVCILHYNPFTKKSRGHLGTMLMQKSWGGLALNRFSSGVEVTNKGLTRKASTDNFLVDFDRNRGDIIECNRVYDSVKKEKEKAEQDDYIESLFNEKFELSHSDIMRKLMETYSIPEKNKTKANRMIDHAVKSGRITKGDNGRYTLTDLPVLFTDDYNNIDDDDDENKCD